MSAYTDDRPFSIDLVGAVRRNVIAIILFLTDAVLLVQVIRQGSFIDKMCQFGWTNRGMFDEPEEEVVLQHALARYHAYVCKTSFPRLLLMNMSLKLS